ncbi:hypothetical protein Esti_004143 [Eimeria stiedai]
MSSLGAPIRRGAPHRLRAAAAGQPLGGPPCRPFCCSSKEQLRQQQQQQKEREGQLQKGAPGRFCSLQHCRGAPTLLRASFAAASGPLADAGSAHGLSCCVSSNRSRLFSSGNSSSTGSSSSSRSSKSRSSSGESCLCGDEGFPLSFWLLSPRPLTRRRRGPPPSGVGGPLASIKRGPPPSQGPPDDLQYQGQVKGVTCRGIAAAKAWRLLQCVQALLQQQQQQQQQRPNAAPLVRLREDFFAAADAAAAAAADAAAVPAAGAAAAIETDLCKAEDGLGGAGGTRGPLWSGGGPQYRQGPHLDAAQAVSRLASMAGALPPRLLAAAAAAAASMVSIHRRMGGSEETLEAAAATLASTARLRLHELGPRQLAELIEGLTRCSRPKQQQQQVLSLDREVRLLLRAALPALPASLHRLQSFQEAQRVAWVLLRCGGLHTQAAVQRLQDLLLFQLSFLSQQQQQQQRQQQQQQWAPPTLREATSLAAALHRCGSLDSLLLQQLWLAFCRGLGVAGLSLRGLSLPSSVLRSVAAAAPLGSVAVDGRRLAQAAAATQLPDPGLWMSLFRLLQRAHSSTPTTKLLAFACSLPPGGPPGALSAGPPLYSLGRLVFAAGRDFAWKEELHKDMFAAAQLLHLTGTLPSPAAACADAPLLLAAAAAVRTNLLLPSSSSSSSKKRSSSSRGGRLGLAEAQHVACCWVSVSRLLCCLPDALHTAAAAVYPQLSSSDALSLLACRSSSSSSSNSSNSNSSSSVSLAESVATHGVSLLQPGVPAAAAAAALAAAAAATSYWPEAAASVSSSVGAEQQELEAQQHGWMLQRAEELPHVAAAAAAAAVKASSRMESLLFEAAAAAATGAAVRPPPPLLQLLQQSWAGLLQLRAALAEDVLSRAECLAAALLGDSSSSNNCSGSSSNSSNIIINSSSSNKGRSVDSRERGLTAAAAAASSGSGGHPGVAAAWASAAAAAHSCGAPSEAVDAALQLMERQLVASRQHFEEELAAAATAAPGQRVAARPLQQLVVAAAVLHALSVCGARRRAALHSVLPGLRRAIFYQQQQMLQQQQQQVESEDTACVWQCWADIFLSLVELQAIDSLGATAGLLHAQLLQQATRLSDEALLLLLQAQLLLCCGSPVAAPGLLQLHPAVLEAAETAAAAHSSSSSSSMTLALEKKQHHIMPLEEGDPSLRQELGMTNSSSSSSRDAMSGLHVLLLEAERRQRQGLRLQAPCQLLLLTFALHFIEGLDPAVSARCSRLQLLARRLAWRKEAIAAAAAAGGPQTAAAGGPQTAAAAAGVNPEGFCAKGGFFSRASPWGCEEGLLLVPAAACSSSSSSHKSLAMQIGAAGGHWADRWVCRFAAEAVALRAGQTTAAAACAAEAQREGGALGGPLGVPRLEGWVVADGHYKEAPSGALWLLLRRRQNFWLTQDAEASQSEAEAETSLPAAPLRLLFGYLAKRKACGSRGVEDARVSPLLSLCSSFPLPLANFKAVDCTHLPHGGLVGSAVLRHLPPLLLPSELPEAQDACCLYKRTRGRGLREGGEGGRLEKADAFSFCRVPPAPQLPAKRQ